MAHPPTQILHGLDLQVARGTSVCLLGPSGSGKSSLLAILAGLERATGGTVRVAASTSANLNEDGLARARRGRIGIVLQAFHLLPTMTARENVAVPLSSQVCPTPSPAPRRLQAVGLGNRLDHYPAQLSGGEQQRVAIARAWRPARRLSSPTNRRAISTQRRGAAVMDLLFARHADLAATLFVITHDPSLAARCDRIIEMADGRIVADTRR